METKKHSTGHSHLWIGSIIVLVGIVALLDNFDIIYAWDIFRYWPVLFVIWGYYRIRNARGSFGFILGTFFAALGIMMLIQRIFHLYFDFWDWSPVILIAIGGGLLVNSFRWRTKNLGAERETPDIDSAVNLFAFMSGCNRLCKSDDFRGGELTAIMGGCELDLTQSHIKEPHAIINVFTVWGGITIKVPPDWSVSLEGISFLGGMADKTVPSKPEQTQRLVIRGQAIMAGVDIVN